MGGPDEDKQRRVTDAAKAVFLKGAPGPRRHQVPGRQAPVRLRSLDGPTLRLDHPVTETREVHESTHAFAQDVVEDALTLFERDLTARLMAGAIVGLKTRCRDSAALRQEIHALIATMIRA